MNIYSAQLQASGSTRIGVSLWLILPNIYLECLQWYFEFRTWQVSYQVGCRKEFTSKVFRIKQIQLRQKFFKKLIIEKNILKAYEVLWNSFFTTEKQRGLHWNIFLVGLKWSSSSNSDNFKYRQIVSRTVSEKIHYFFKYKILFWATSTSFCWHENTFFAQHQVFPVEL